MPAEDCEVQASGAHPDSFWQEQLEPLLRVLWTTAVLSYMLQAEPASLVDLAISDCPGRHQRSMASRIQSSGHCHRTLLEVRLELRSLLREGRHDACDVDTKPRRP